MSAIAATAGTAISSAHVIKRSVTLLLSLVRISRDLPSHLPYTSRSLSPFLALSSLQLGRDFHVFRRLLSSSKAQTILEGDPPLFQVGKRLRSHICQVAIFWRN